MKFPEISNNYGDIYYSKNTLHTLSDEKQRQIGKEFFDYLDDLKKIRESVVLHQVEDFNITSLKTIKDREDFENVSKLIEVDYKQRNSVGFNSLNECKNLKDLANNDFYNVSLLMASDRINNITKNQIISLTENHSSYKNIAYPARVQGLFDKELDTEASFSFSKKIMKDSIVLGALKRTCENDTNVSSFTKDNFGKIATSIELPPPPKGSEITSTYHKFKKGLETINNCFKEEMPGVERLRDSFNDFMLNLSNRKVTSKNGMEEMLGEFRKVTDFADKVQISFHNKSLDFPPVEVNAFAL